MYVISAWLVWFCLLVLLLTPSGAELDESVREINPSAAVLPPSEVHVFDNGVIFLKKHLIPVQISRYSTVNIHEPEVEKVFSSILQSICTEDRIFLDIGAAGGYYCILAKKLCPTLHIVAVNPVKKFRDMMAEHVGLNGGFPYISVPHAITDNNETKFVNIHKGFGSGIISGRSSNHHAEHVAAMTMNSLLPIALRDQSQSARIGLMMIDVQGQEEKILRNWTVDNTRVDNILIGTHSPSIHEKIVAKYSQLNEYMIKLSKPRVNGEPDGILWIQRLAKAS